MLSSKPQFGAFVGEPLEDRVAEGLEVHDVDREPAEDPSHGQRERVAECARPIPTSTSAKRSPVDAQVPVGFSAIRLRFDPGTDANDEPPATLLRLDDAHTGAVLVSGRLRVPGHSG
jgi:hypothetical protein